MRNRGTLVISLALLSGLATGSWWLAEEARRSDATPKAIAHDIDYYSDKITLTRMDERGLAQYVVDSDRLVHFADDDSAELTQVHMVGKKPDRPEMRVRADRGKTTGDGQEVRLFGNVMMKRAATDGTPELVAKGPYLLVLPEREIASSDQPIEVTQAGSRIIANGMQYDNGFRTLGLDGGKGGRVHAVIEPRSAHPARGARDNPSNLPPVAPPKAQ